MESGTDLVETWRACGVRNFDANPRPHSTARLMAEYYDYVMALAKSTPDDIVDICREILVRDYGKAD